MLLDLIFVIIVKEKFSRKANQGLILNTRISVITLPSPPTPPAITVDVAERCFERGVVLVAIKIQKEP